VMVIAKNDETHRDLSRQFSERKTERKYHAIAWGHFSKKKDRIETYIARSPKDRKRMTVQNEGKLAITNYEGLAVFPLFSYLKLNLETGRTHQIRVHLSYIGHPVFGDITYGGRNRRLGGLSIKERQFAAELLQFMKRQALHAKTLGFTHPKKQEYMQFDSDLPDDMRILLDRMCLKSE